jgi:hypothetical protein
MYNKISSIILNSGKANGLSDVYIAQPDSLKESLAGKVFIIAEIGGKKTDGRKVLDFLISSIDENYYNDEKILLRDKIEGLKIENIFEAAISKTNKNLSEFLTEEKIRLNTSATNITIGVIFENKLYFSGFGKNKALLIYRHGEQHEIINVEANASDIGSLANVNGDKASFKSPAIFSSVISGEIPVGSYFVFTSEALPEYISGKDMIGIVTKLPPVVAAEQIKNILNKINSFIPFLGIIIKNTVGADNQEIREEVEQNLSAHSSISSLNYTEQKTERMLAPAGLISFSKMYKGARRLISDLKPKPIAVPKKVYHEKEERHDDSASIQSIKSTQSIQSTSPIDFGKVNTLNNMARADSFMIKEKIVFKKRPNPIGANLKRLLTPLAGISNIHLVPGAKSGIKNWFGGMEKKNRLLFFILALVVIIFVGSLVFTNWNKKQQAAKNNYNNLVATISEKQSAIDSFMLYNDENDAKATLTEVQTLLGYLPKEKSDQAIVYKRLEDVYNTQVNKVQKVVKIDSPEKVNDLSGLQATNIVWANGKIYAGASNLIYAVIPSSSESTKIQVTGVSNLNNPRFDRKNIVYYWTGDKIAKLDVKTGKTSLINMSSSVNENFGAYDIYNGNLYKLAKGNNQIRKSVSSVSGYSTEVDWIKETDNLSQVSDISVNGSVYALNANGGVIKFYVNKKVDYSAVAISPAMSAASKIIAGTNYIYVFDAGSKRLAVLAIKDGHLLNQYQVDSLSPSDFAVDERNKTAYFLSGEMIYKIPLNQ